MFPLRAPSLKLSTTVTRRSGRFVARLKRGCPPVELPAPSSRFSRFSLGMLPPSRCLVSRTCRAELGHAPISPAGSGHQSQKERGNIPITGTNHRRGSVAARHLLDAQVRRDSNPRSFEQ
eukprot:1183398-Prorocentrum_minimum.AAC.5